MLIKPLATKAYDRRASGDCGTSGLYNIYLCTYYSGWVSCENSFVWASRRVARTRFEQDIKTESTRIQWDSNPSAPKADALDHLTTLVNRDDELCLKVSNDHGMWIKSTRNNDYGYMCIWTYRQTKLTFFYYCRYYLLLSTNLCMNTSNHVQFDTCLPTSWF